MTGPRAIKTLRRALLALVPVVTATLVSGCGSESAPASRPGGWRAAILNGVAGASGVAALDDVLVICAGEGSRQLYLVERASLTDRSDGTTLPVRPLPLEVLRDRPLEGFGVSSRDEFAAQGYVLGTLWDHPVDITALAVRRMKSSGPAPDRDALYLLERSHGVIYRGRLDRDASGRVAGAKVESAFVVPDRQRAGQKGSDWRDSSAGLAGLLSVPREAQSEDLYVVERSSTAPHEVRVDRLDRYGSWQGRFTLKVPGLPADASADVGDLGWVDGRFVLLRGEGRGALHSASDPGDFARTEVSSPVPGPDVPGAGPWRGLAYLADGTTFLVSAGSPSWVAWRGP